MIPVLSHASARLAWAREVLGDNHLKLAPASADASFRSYWRTQNAGQSWIVMDSPPAQEDPRPWLDIGARLAGAGLHVPAVRAHDLQRGFLLIEDLGSRLYLPELRNDTVDALYGAALDALLRMQCVVAADDLPTYDRAFLSRELELMPEWFLGTHLGCTPTCEEWDALEEAFTIVLHAALEQPRCFVHRDYHSRNLLIVDEVSAVPPTPGGAEMHASDPLLGNPGIIDFQGALHGPITYDLASLLRDCYIVWDRQRVEAWVENYRQRLLGTRWHSEIPDQARFLRWFDLTGLQRHIKVLGIFCRLHYRDGKVGYLDDLPRVYRYVIDVAGRYPELHAFTALLRHYVGARDLRATVSA
ncbi:MAG: phosphotransferase [Rhodanobacter sp.]